LIKPRKEGVNANCVQRIYDEGQAQLFETQQEKRKVEDDKEYAKVQRRDLAEKERRTRKTSVVKTYGGEKKGNACGVDDTCQRQKDKVDVMQFFELFLEPVKHL
jgi:superfamily II DNA helicase RecQ